LNKLKSPGISIIVPVYNASLFLEKCLNSLINQTYKNIEIICIDSYSTDNSLDILKKFKQTDNRIRIIEEKENKGAGYNRNLGISSVTKEYIGFVDSDDYVDLDFYEKLYTVGKKYNADIVMGGTKIISYQLNKIMLIHNYNFKFEHSFDKKIKTLKEGTCWDKIYKTKLIKSNKNIRFPEGVVHEDNLFVLKAIYNCNKLITVSGSYYYWIRNPYSVCFNQEYNDKRITDAYTVMELVIEYIKEKKINENTAFILIKFMLDHFGYHALDNIRYEDKLINMIKEIVPCIKVNK
jgi:glycosyltransferase involved in cell wall biosynthesis